MVTRTRLRIGIVALFAAGTGLMVVLPGADKQRNVIAATTLAVEAMPADDAKTWQTILNERLMSEMVSGELEKLSRPTRSRATFMRGFRAVEVSGLMIKMIGNIGTYMFEGEDAQKAAALRKAGEDLVEASKKKDHAMAEKAVAVIASYPAKIEPAESGDPIKFEELLTLEEVMKGVARADTDTGAASKKVGPSFNQEARLMFSQSYLLACLGVIARVHVDEDDWRQWCDEMREGSIKMAEQFQRKDAQGARDARAELQKSCTECHEVYRDE